MEESTNATADPFGENAGCADGLEVEIGTVGMDDEIAVDSPHDKIVSICGAGENNGEAISLIDPSMSATGDLSPTTENAARIYSSA